MALGPGSHWRASLCLIAEEGRALGRGTLRAAWPKWLSGTRAHARGGRRRSWPGAVLLIFSLRCRRVALQSRPRRSWPALQRSSTQSLGLYAISRSTAVDHVAQRKPAQPSLRGYDNLRIASSDTSTRCNSAFTSTALVPGIARSGAARPVGNRAPRRSRSTAEVARRRRSLPRAALSRSPGHQHRSHRHACSGAPVLNRGHPAPSLALRATCRLLHRSRRISGGRHPHPCGRRSPRHRARLQREIGIAVLLDLGVVQRASRR